MKKGLVIIGVVAVSSIVLISAGPQTKKTWEIPDKYKTMKNPVKVSESGMDDAKDLWNKQCKSCHGSNGAGDGIKAKNLKKSCGNFTTTEFASLSDGSIMYLSFINKNEDHDFDKKIPDDVDRWNLVNYIRTLKK